MPASQQVSFPAKAENPVRRGFSASSRCLWNTGSPAIKPGDDSEFGTTFSPYLSFTGTV
ncbi:hypothetical protein ACVWYH_001426 [Bradyrhizobium sp. GM24.11]|jgi:hypothetical protein